MFYRFNDDIVLRKGLIHELRAVPDGVLVTWVWLEKGAQVAAHLRLPTTLASLPESLLPLPDEPVWPKGFVALPTIVTRASRVLYVARSTVHDGTTTILGQISVTGAFETVDLGDTPLDAIMAMLDGYAWERQLARRLESASADAFPPRDAAGRFMRRSA